MNNCCDSFGNCTRGFGCPAGLVLVAKAGKQMPVIELVDTDLVQADAFVSRMYDQQEQDDAMSAMRMLAYALVSVALVGAAVALAVFITIFNQP